MPTHTAWMRLQSYPRRVKLTLAVYAIAFLVGTSTHFNCSCMDGGSLIIRS
jgi:hypothetical protein